MSRRQERAYRVAGQAIRRRLERERPGDARELDAVTSGEVVEVRGCYDRVATVLRATGVPFVSVPPGRLDELDWNRAKTVLVNCPGHLAPHEIEIVREWVRAGGTLFTTDWALKHTLEPAFPGRVRHNGRTTPDCVVGVETVADDPMLSGFLEDGRAPRWWLEGSSYPIEILDREHVEVLLRSAEVGRRWGADPVVVRWREARGEVVHMLSHLYLQRTETRGVRDAAPAGAFFADSGFDAADVRRYSGEAGDLNAAELKSAYTSAALASELLLRAKKRARSG